jgi:hypothetical protein
MQLRRILALFFVCAALLAAASCSRPLAQSSDTSKLLGAWYDNTTGDEYKFISDSMLVVPHVQTGGGNAVTYRIVDGDKLDILSGGSHHVSVIESVTAERLELADPVNGAKQYFYRNITRTQHLKSVEASARVAVSEFGTVTPDPTIVWVGKKPTGKGTEWVDWAPTSLSTYGGVWDWSTLKRDKAPALTSGDGDSMGFSFSFARKVPTAKEMKALYDDTGIEATAGAGRIDVGYSASKAKYPAGTMVYYPGGLIYSLGDGYAIGVDIDRKGESFVPRTHK